MDDFDPYYIWLGIPPEEQPPDHYRLLGLRRFEQNPDVIANAAEGKMAYLRTLQVGKRSKQSQALLNEIAAAQACLLNPQARAKYDEKLRGPSAATGAKVPSPIAPGVQQVAGPKPPYGAPPLAPLPVPVGAPVNPLSLPPQPLAIWPAASPAPPALVPVGQPVYPTYGAPRPSGRSDNAWVELQARLESLPRGAVIALGVGPVVIAVLVLLAVVSATSGQRPGTAGNVVASAPQAVTADFGQQPPRVVPPTPPQPMVLHSAPPVNNGRPLPAGMPGPMMPITSVRFQVDAAGGEMHRALLSRRGDYLAVDATHSGKRQVLVFHTPSARKLIGINTPSPTGLFALADNLVLVASEPTSITAFDADSGELRTLRPVAGQIRDVAVSDDRMSAFVLTDDALLVLDTVRFEQRANLLQGRGQHAFRTLQTHGNLIMAVGEEGLEVFDVRAGQLAAGLSYSRTMPCRAFLLDDQSYYRLFQVGGAVHYERQGLRDRGRFAGTVLPGARPVDDLVPNVRGGNRIAWQLPGRELALFDLMLGRPVARIVGSKGQLSTIALSGDGDWLAARDGDGPLSVVHVQPLLFNYNGVTWPGMQSGNRGSISGPAIKNVGVSSITRN